MEDTEFEALFYVSTFDFGHLNTLNIPKWCLGKIQADYYGLYGAVSSKIKHDARKQTQT